MSLSMSGLKYSLVPLLLVSLATGGACAADGYLTGVWNGTYEYPQGSTQLPVRFTAVFLHSGGNVTGLIKEPNTFASGDAPWLHAVIKGRYDERTGDLTFTKTYDGTAKTEHDVQYAGRLSGDGKKVSGRWQIRDDWGAGFTLEKAPQSGAGQYSGVWSGEYDYPAELQRQAVKFVMLMVYDGTGLTGYIKEPNTFGAGDDPYLHADVAINVDPQSRTLSFTKKYDGTGKVAHEVHYSGLLSSDGARVSGKWEIPDVWGARFRLQRVGDGEAGEKLSEKFVARKEPLLTP